MPERVALVTGASRGIGAATARRLARDGMAVAINSHPEERMVATADRVAAGIRDDGGTAAVYVADIAEAGAVDAMFGRCEEELGRVGVLVTNAAVTRRTEWTDLTEADWDRILGVNLTGAWLCARRAFGESPAEGGAIVTVSSVLARIGAADSVPYATTKAGLLGFTRSMARALGPAGVRVNSVMPGAIRTEEELEAYPDQEAMERQALSRQALQRRGLAEDIANVVSFLAGPDSAFMTGQTVCVDGGWVLH
ncbi:SDR family NAD(P)-dependent oxidoreductase [Actinoallomurus iriomotensis]|uniref:Beta-ketoacyl-ACP reductase n=1 Tax=Actinoallomurus iriomotensis TaxID=478107 RepID=A0A9W6RKW0_9ACTN|nr:SDR family oxidoreductase [Actinoallomurus iriomotensis]GLY77568.1 beta-ketoacyl-ACP reductase [Actinoallomurus iriomotensis]